MRKTKQCRAVKLEPGRLRTCTKPRLHDDERHEDTHGEWELPAPEARS